MTPTSARYDLGTIAFHWTMAALIIAIFAIGLSIDAFPKEQKSLWINLHSVFGLLVLVLWVGRLIWRVTHKAPPLPDSMSPLMKRASHAVHGILYLLMLGVPMIGIPTLLYRGRGLDFGFVQIASPFARTPEIFKPLTEVHEIGAFVLIGLALAHALAAIYHQFVLRDGVLSRMSPH